MTIRSLSTKPTPLRQSQLRWHRRRWSTLRAWIREEWRQSHVVRDRVEVSRDRDTRRYLGGRGSGPRI